MSRINRFFPKVMLWLWCFTEAIEALTRTKAVVMCCPDVLECGVPIVTDKPREMQASTVEARHLLIKESAFEAQISP